MMLSIREAFGGDFERVAKGTVTNVVNQGGCHRYLRTFLIIIGSNLNFDAFSQLPCSMKNPNTVSKSCVSSAWKY